MSWPQWQPPVQPTMPMMNATMPMGIQYSAEQWQQMQQQNWQQWAQWQQQYQQWHQQYGAEYQKSLTAMASMSTPAIINTSAPPPLPNDTKPPPPPEEPAQHLLINTQKPPPTVTTAAVAVPNLSQKDVNSSLGGNTQSKPNTNTWIQNSNSNLVNHQRQLTGKRQALEYHNGGGSTKKNKLEWQQPPTTGQTAPSLSSTSNVFGPHLPEESKDDLSDPEKKFMKQFAEWEAQFNKWKEQNQDHPDKTQYREYEKKWEAWRNQLLERREAMRKKRLGLSTSASTVVNNVLDSTQSSLNVTANPIAISSEKCPPPSDSSDAMINPINSKVLATLFKNNTTDGIPGLDLVDAPAQPDDISVEKDKSMSEEPAKPASSQPTLNLEDLSKNLNSILGDQKLLSMLSLVAQTAAGAKTDHNNGRNIETTPQMQSTPSGITLAPLKSTSDDQNSNWSSHTASSGNGGGNSNLWGQEQSIRRDFSNKDLNFTNTVVIGNDQSSVGPGTSEQFGTRNVKSGHFSAKEGNYNKQSGDHFPANKEYSQNNEESWSANGAKCTRIQLDMDDMVPAPPMITNEMLHIENITDYEHKSLKQDTTDVRVFTPRLFDYRHKLVTRIPLSERPKWLSETFHNIPEFNPPISRIGSYPRHHQDRYPHVPPSTGNRYNEMSPFSRRPPPFMADNSTMGFNKLIHDRHDDSRRRNNQDDFDRHRKSGSGQESRSDDRGYSREKDRYRDKERGRSRELSKGRDIKELYEAHTKKNEPVVSFKNSPKENTFSQSQPLFGSTAKLEESRRNSRTTIDDILNMPGRLKRPQRIVIILRGPPGSGKTFLAKQIKDKETKNGGSAPRILSLDDYFMVEQEREVIEDGKTIKVKDMVYEYEECMETSYRQSLFKTFKKTITDGYFPFIIVDNVNDKLKYFEEMWSFSKQNGFQVYICQLDLDVQMCTKRNTHGRSEVEIQHIVNGWEELPSHYGIIDATNLIQAGAITEVEMEEINSPNDNFDDDDDIEEQTCNSSKWDNFECSIDNLAKLDGINKPLRSARTMEDYLQLDEWTPAGSESKPGQKRVRWADLEERKEQEKMRAIGFVVGQTDWGRMMDPTQGGSALTQTKYIERVGVRRVNMN